MTRRFAMAALAALWLAAAAAQAHDSWLSPAPAPAAGSPTLALSTGNRFPRQEFSQSAGSLAQAQCRDGAGRLRPLHPVREQAQWLDLAMDADDAWQAPLACWVELHESEIELAAHLVPVYLNEVRPPPATRQAWAEIEQRKLPWRERYRKYARIELPAAPGVPAAMVAAARQPAGLGLEIVVLGDQPIVTGQPVAFQVLRDGRPLEGFSVELVSERSPLGIWQRTDAQGMVRHRLPFDGRWLLRGVDLRASQQAPGTWESRFVTLALEAR